MAEVAKAVALIDLALRACTAYDRPDAATRLTAAKESLADPVLHVVVAGEFKQGKSSLVNALVGATVCTVDDDVATAVPTYVRHGAKPEAALLYEPGRREPIPVADVRRYVLEGGAGGVNSDRVSGVEVRIPRKILAGGLVLVDTPGVGGLGSPHAAASLAAVSMADAVLFVTGAAQELTRSEVDFLQRARSLCPVVACVVTKTDFYPAWRRIRELNERHLAAHCPMPLMPVSSALRSRAVKANDTALNTESGFTHLVAFLTEKIGASAVDRLAGEAAAEVFALCEQLDSRFQAERAALADPEAAARVVRELTVVKERVEALKSAAAKWNQTLSDGVTDLTSDVDHDLRARVRVVIAEADTAIEEGDPADTWAEMEAWLQSRMADELLANYELLRDRATDLGVRVGDHFHEASTMIMRRPTVADPTPLATVADFQHKIDLDRMKLTKQAMVALKSAYGGALMFIILGSLVGVSLGPIGIGIGLVMGHRGLRDEKKRQVTKRRAEARNAIRRYCDEVSFVAGKDSRDTLRRVQRQLRDHYSGLAEELNKANAQALNSAAEAAKRTHTDREKRLKDVDAELARVQQLRQRAQAVAK
ncbi:dynamin [Actinoplanes lobatus]|uniref:Dynamin n=1 Tax=Actinoplanes lobatus TaxID=113568 RepID=A0A7W7MIF6_9ACTN|nr:dynamin family protein [Actinoplanes lobatus]MBB4751351.1 gas vesicle protein [Actinoplanes lobatus]GGN63652.1 dynamin [Actinoplanes lobatus]GIE40960.1 dynamin [Actinoplanes lobatus]